MKLSVIIPAYNEAAVIEATLQEVDLFCQQNFTNDYEIIVVDDGSKDLTAEIVNSQAKIRLIKQDINLGKGAAVKVGMLAARGELLLMMDADNSTRIIELPTFISALATADIAIGSRAVKGAKIKLSQSAWKVAFGRAGNVFIRWWLKLNIADTQCGFKLYRRKAVDLFRQSREKGYAFDFEILYLAQKVNMTIQELPIVWTNMPDSKVRLRFYLSTILGVFRVQYNYYRGNYHL